ncbi:hypothetical protein CEXT_437751 [Caerostris extrusa]|uniref:Uncharacterized protein n=1 Tax=Caerostris extrusa TaxID=172846 RepID=A0AAV4YAD5_CAEEX|nr:hypothetical protein CEXT_437751 [Caerostris extrusa]
MAKTEQQSVKDYFKKRCHAHLKRPQEIIPQSFTKWRRNVIGRRPHLRDFYFGKAKEPRRRRSLNSSKVLKEEHDLILCRC